MQEEMAKSYFRIRQRDHTLRVNKRSTSICHINSTESKKWETKSTMIAMKKSVTKNFYVEEWSQQEQMSL